MSLFKFRCQKFNMTWSVFLSYVKQNLIFKINKNKYENKIVKNGKFPLIHPKFKQLCITIDKSLLYKLFLQ